MRRWGRVLRDAIGQWYEGKEADRLAYQVVKYQQREGWSHRDLLRKSHPSGRTPVHKAIYDYVTHGWGTSEESYEVILPDIVYGVEAIKTAQSEPAVIQLIEKYRLTHEMVPNQWKKSPAVWETLLRSMPMFAMIRNLATMTNRGLIAPMSDATRFVVSKLGNAEILHKARIHPISLLSAWNTYKDGKGFRGRQTWTPVQNVINALEGAFYESFGAIPSTGANIMLGLDVSSSMSVRLEQYGLNMSARDAAAVLAMVTGRREPMSQMVAFSTRRGRAAWSNWRSNTALVDFPVDKNESLQSVVNRMDRMPFGGTDCALPMIGAMEKNLPVDAIAIYTDNETWAGDIQPAQALRDLRKQINKPTKLVVVGMTSTGFSIADPEDSHSLDVVGFNTRTPKLISDFIAS
jgi:60 kDa SS-A/Ro ribonucleoprotein